MYATCIFCHNGLGRNESLEEFPIGRRLAFDSARGRLWVVCPSCKRWNLSPLETRWEAMEAAERLYRDTKTRVATDQIGLAKVREGLELVRVGRPLLPEFAAWRYGDVFTSRWRREKTWLAASVALSLVGTGVSVAMRGNPAWGFVPTALNLLNTSAAILRTAHQLRNHRVSIVSGDGDRLEMSPRFAARTDIVPHAMGGWFLRVRHLWIVPASGDTRPLHERVLRSNRLYQSYVEGDDARRALAAILPAVNLAGASRKKIREAVDHVLVETPNAQRSYASGLDSNVVDRYVNSRRGVATRYASTNTQLALVPMHIRLAMEMSLHEADERRALEGELHELETRWREAEEIAAIADGLLLPDTIDTKVESLRKANHPPRDPGER